MVWRAAVDGEARILSWGASAGVRRGGFFFCFLRGSLPGCRFGRGTAALCCAGPFPLV